MTWNNLFFWKLLIYSTTHRPQTDATTHAWILQNNKVLYHLYSTYFAFTTSRLSQPLCFTVSFLGCFLNFSTSINENFNFKVTHKAFEEILFVYYLLVLIEFWWMLRRLLIERFQLLKKQLVERLLKVTKRNMTKIKCKSHQKCTILK